MTQCVRNVLEGVMASSGEEIEIIEYMYPRPWHTGDTMTIIAVVELEPNLLQSDIFRIPGTGVGGFSPEA